MKLSVKQNGRGRWQWTVDYPNGRHVSAREFGTEKAALRDGKRVLGEMRKR